MSGRTCAPHTLFNLTKDLSKLDWLSECLNEVRETRKVIKGHQNSRAL